jgi:hypothetical protein
MRRLAALFATLKSNNLLLVFGLAVLAMTVTVGMAEKVFPYGTTDLDEVSYQTQANVLRDGHLDLDAARRVPFFVPFLSGVRADRVVFKYQPEWPALIATSDVLFGSSLPLRMLCSAAGVLAVGWLGWELTKEQRVALLAAALALASPFTWVQGASLLGYQLSFVLGTGAAAALLRAARMRRMRAWIVVGVLVGLSALHRPFDTVLAVAPVLVYLACTMRKELAHLRGVLAMFVGAAPFAAVLLAYNAAVMGNPLRLAYGVTGPQDTFLFGWRASYLTPGTGHAYELHYTFGRAWSTLGHDLGLMPRFVALAPLVLFCAGAAVWSRRKDPRSWLLVGMVVVVVGGYFFWWATANAELFGIDRGLGPFYDYAALAPLCVLGAWGLTSVKWRTRWLVALAAFALIWGIGASWNVLSFARQEGRIRSNDVRLTEPASTQPTLVIVAPTDPGDPYLKYASDDRLDSKRLVALDVAGRRLELVSQYPNREPFLVREYRPFGNLFGPTVRDRVRLAVLRGDALTLRLLANVTPPREGSSYLRIGDRPPILASSGSGPLRSSWTITPAMLPSGPTITVAVGVTTAAPGQPAPHTMTQQWYECRFEVRDIAHEIELLAPCDGWNHYEFQNGRTALSNENVSNVLNIDVARDRVNPAVTTRG